jgi:hypothetical protein
MEEQRQAAVLQESADILKTGAEAANTAGLV